MRTRRKPKLVSVSSPVLTLIVIPAVYALVKGWRLPKIRSSMIAQGESDHIQLVPNTIGHDYGEEVEVISGVGRDDLVVVNPNDSVTSGQPVHVAAQGS